MAHKKGAGSSDNGRDSKSKRLGVKLFGGQRAVAGNIIIRQRGTQFHAGDNVYMGRDHTLHAAIDGLVVFKRSFKDRRFVSIEPYKEVLETPVKSAKKASAPKQEAVVAPAAKSAKKAAAVAEAVAEEVVDESVAVAEEVAAVPAVALAKEEADAVVEVPAAKKAAAPKKEAAPAKSAAPKKEAAPEKEAAPKKEPASAPARQGSAGGKASADKKGPKLDDLKIIEGVGPKIETLLKEGGISTWAELAAASEDRIKEILAAAGPRYQIHDPSTWPAQAKFAAGGQWDELKEYQDMLTGGRDKSE